LYFNKVILLDELLQISTHFWGEILSKLNYGGNFDRFDLENDLKVKYYNIFRILTYDFLSINNSNNVSKIDINGVKSRFCVYFGGHFVFSILRPLTRELVLPTFIGRIGIPKLCQKSMLATFTKKCP